MIARSSDPFAPPAGRRAAWSSLDLGALAGALDGTRPLARGEAHLGPKPLGSRRIPASAFVPVSAPPPPRATALEAEEPARPQRVAGLPRRHKLMLAAAAAVMALGLLRAGRAPHGPVAGPAPAALPAAG